jgi:DNA-binding NarL/FixJ family response regulator
MADSRYAAIVGVMQAETWRAPRTPIKVVVVDDHPSIRVGLRSTLTSEGTISVVGEAADGEAALATVREQEPDVVVLDMLLPHANGIDVIKRLLAERPGLKIVAFSMRESPWFVKEILSAGAAGYVFKRSPPAELTHAVQQVANGLTYVDRAVAKELATAGARRDEPHARGALLSKREAEVLRLLARGLAGKEAADLLDLSPRTLETYKARAMQKLQLRSRADLMRFANHSGWLREPDELIEHD